MLPDLITIGVMAALVFVSQCTYRCVVLPDLAQAQAEVAKAKVSMHLQVRGAP